MSLPPLTLRYIRSEGTIEGIPSSERRLSELSDSFIDLTAYECAMQAGDCMVYKVTNVESAGGEGQLHYGLGLLMPGRIGKEYFHTRGHIHSWRPAAEVYICLEGQGLMLLENEDSGACEAVEMKPDQVIYVPGHTAHQTVNTGDVPLIYWGVLSCDAGHDYEYVRKNGFRQLVIEENGRPTVVYHDDWKERK